MTKKERTIKAIKMLLQDYKKGIFLPSNCPLCDIHFNFKCKVRYAFFPTCKGCPDADKGGWNGCVDFSSWKKLPVDFSYRIKFWEQHLPKIKKMDSKLFTPKGWKHFNLKDVI